MSQLEEIADQDGWRCWVCDEPVDRSAPVNDARGASIDSRSVKPGKGGAKNAKGGGDFAGGERLAHRACNTRKGAVTAVIPWPPRLLLAEPAALLAVADRLSRKGGREIVARSPDRGDAEAAATWLVERFSRLAPGLTVSSAVEPGGGQFLIALVASARGGRR